MTQTRDGRTIEIADNVDRRQFEARVEGAVVGRAVYRIDGDSVVFTHTEVDPELQGQGVATVLARKALEAVRASGRAIVPLCPFIAAYLQRHAEQAS